MMLEPREILRFAEGIGDLTADREEELLSQLASSTDLQKKIAVLRRSLYLVECQIPDYRPSAELLLEVEKLSRLWTARASAKEPVLPKKVPWRKIALFIAGTLIALSLFLNLINFV